MSTSWKTRLIHADVRVPEGYRSLAAPTFRGSTTLFSSASSVSDAWNQYETGYTYGLYGTPTTLELAERIRELEQGYRTVITPGGQSAISLINLAFLGAGDHVLLPASIYGPHRKLADNLLRRFGLDHSYYEPTVGEGIQAVMKPNTRLVWCESPGSITMEVQDLPAITRVAHANGTLVAVDNTWSGGVYFDALAHGADITMQALTKYVGGHSDLLLGSVTVKNEADWQKVGATHQELGFAASPDDCTLALRGMKTLAVRLAAIEASALSIARWLADRPEIERVLHPALNSCPGHEIWRRDFTGSSGVFAIVFRSGTTKEQVVAFVDALQIFKIGYSWGGVTSLAVAYDLTEWTGRPNYQHRIVRLNIGLEDTDDLIADLERGLRKMFGYA
ncbi:Cystathionine beta-lyase [Acidisarcina polymorpha]|uniref:Cystathionine beta-lyase n=1 Tax=Acidisarcina polymorpha TaxID=2211140 RepID=A0A2Z5FX05_9BACT|nr:cystathionine beta-lyase [Acidisarcina polymorpha]AXC11250.1 Cystathionine beta-lyase [Acidisarcina polymorpha]